MTHSPPSAPHPGPWPHHLSPDAALDLFSLLLPILQTPRPRVIFGRERPDSIATQLRLVLWLLLALRTELKLLLCPRPWALRSPRPPPRALPTPAVMAPFCSSSTPRTSGPLSLPFPLPVLPPWSSCGAYSAPSPCLGLHGNGPPSGDVLTSLRQHLPRYSITL